MDVRRGASAQQPLFSRSDRAEETRIVQILRKETVGGALLVLAALIALIWANSPFAESYFALRDTRIGIASWHLDLTLGTWASDGLLAIFFFLVGLELKRELLVGGLRDKRTAVVPLLAAVGGVVVPALLFVVINAGDLLAMRGWAVPTATDIAFAVAVLALIGSHLPPALRIFLLTLAVVDDLIAIVIIAVFYTETIYWVPALLAIIPIAAYALLSHKFRLFFEQRKWAAWVILLPLGVLAWALVHASGIHATIAGVILGFMVPVLSSKNRPNEKLERDSLAEEFEHRFRPLSAGVAVPVFAFFSAGVAVGGMNNFFAAVFSPLGIGILVALVLGKPLGIVGVTWVTTKWTRATLDENVKWIDLIGVGMLAGIGFTVSLLLTELSFAAGSVENDIAKIAILTAAVGASALASVVLIARNRRYRALERATQPEQITQKTD